MPLNITVKTFEMAREDRQLAEIIQKAANAEKGDTILFPEYGAYTVEGSQKAYDKLRKTAVSQRVTLITSLNRSGDDLPHAQANVNYNTLFIFSRTGQVYSPQAKITPQSFELHHLDESFPRINVTPYSHLNKVTLRQNGETSTAFFFICSDLYTLQLFDEKELKSDAIICPANFGNGAEGAAGEVIEYTVKSGLFKQGFFSNNYQTEKKGLTPFTVAVERVFENDREKIVFSRGNMKEILKKSCAVYPDGKYRNFKSVLEITLTGIFAVPWSRSLEDGLKIELGVYDKIVEL